MNKKAVVVGGSNGIGLAISSRLIAKGYYLEICDLVPPDGDLINSDSYHYNHCDLLYFDEDLFFRLASNQDVQVLVVTAGIGRIAEFFAHHVAEIEKILTIDAVSTIKLFRIFYDRISSKEPFYAGVMGSIAGWVSTPCASVYAAAKVSVIRFAESVNIELEMSGTDNRILDISTTSFKGSRFYGKSDDLSLILPLADEILMHLFGRETRFIPQYDEIFKGVFDRYSFDPHEYGIHSYQFTKASGRFDNSKKVRIGYLSGTFDLL